MEGLLWGAVVGGIAGFLRQTAKDRMADSRKRRQTRARMQECPALRGLDTTEDHLLVLFEMAENAGLREGTEAHDMLTRASNRIETLATTYVRAMQDEKVDMCEATMARTGAITALEEVTVAGREIGLAAGQVHRSMQARKHIENNVQQLLKCLQTLALAKKTLSTASSAHKDDVTGGVGPLHRKRTQMARHGRAARRGTAAVRRRRRKSPPITYGGDDDDDEEESITSSSSSSSSDGSEVVFLPPARKRAKRGEWGGGGGSGGGGASGGGRRVVGGGVGASGAGGAEAGVP